jgi:hypothetical protein
MADRIQITRAVLTMQYLPNSPITERNVESVVDTFEMVLSDLPAETVEAATRQYLSTEIFFPTPGRLREIAMDLQMLAIGLPTPAEAWGMVLSANKYSEKVLCQTGFDLYTAACNARETYQADLLTYSKHLKDCTVCVEGGYHEDYGHPSVAETVRLLGGRDIILTDNPTADRARFIEAYREVVARERTKTAMLPKVKQYIETTQQKSLSTDGAIKQLTKGMSK